MTDPRADRMCHSCGRRFSWRRKWARDWERVRYCSNACRRRGVGAFDRSCESRLLAALECRHGALVHVAALAEAPEEHEPLRRAARRLAHLGRIELIQKGRVVDPSAIRGPVDARLK